MPKQHEVVIQNFTFRPDAVTIKVGDTIVWTNRDAMGHTATRDDKPAFDTGVIQRNTTSRPVALIEPGSVEGFEYYCKPHPHMKGKIYVEP
jgi:plastocyanin